MQQERKAVLTGVFTVTLGSRMSYPAASRATPARRWKIHNSFGTRAGRFLVGGALLAVKKGKVAEGQGQVTHPESWELPGLSDRRLGPSLCRHSFGCSTMETDFLSSSFPLP